jgi:LmbE family N-acetylglucosaminyl deacetylase
MDNKESRLALIRVFRKYRPRLVFTHHAEDISGHPDHHACNRLVRHAAYLAGLAKIDTGQERHRPRGAIFFNLPRRQYPSFVVDVTAVYQEARRALAAYKSQFHQPKSTEPETHLSHAGFLPQLEAVHRYYGSLIGASYGEAFWCERPTRVEDPIAHFAVIG